MYGRCTRDWPGDAERTRAILYPVERSSSHRCNASLSIYYIPIPIYIYIYIYIYVSTIGCRVCIANAVEHSTSGDSRYFTALSKVIHPFLTWLVRMPGISYTS